MRANGEKNERRQNLVFVDCHNLIKRTRPRSFQPETMDAASFGLNLKLCESLKSSTE